MLINVTQPWRSKLILAFGLLPRAYTVRDAPVPEPVAASRVLVAVAAVKTRRRLARTSERVRGAGTGLEPSLGYDRSRIPAMASSQGDVRSSPMAYPPSGAVAAKTPATSTARDADYLLDADYVFGQNMTEHNPAPSPSGHPLLSGPPTLTDIHQIFTWRGPPPCSSASCCTCARCCPCSSPLWPRTALPFSRTR
eukprot:scaffold40955_cov101-Phaeocystis_antarctica.AAC.1